MQDLYDAHLACFVKSESVADSDLPPRPERRIVSPNIADSTHTGDMGVPVASMYLDENALAGRLYNEIVPFIQRVNPSYNAVLDDTL